MTMDKVSNVWVYLSSNPLLHLTMTLVIYQVGDWLYRRFGRSPLLNPVLISVTSISIVLVFTHTSYESYFEGAQFVHFLLGPATVALAIPLYNQFEKVRRSAAGLILALVAGSTVAAGSAGFFAWVSGATPDLIASLIPKSVTTPIAMGVAEKLDGLPSLTAAVVILSGILGAILGPPILNWLGLLDSRAQGLALGVASHGIGAGRALQINETAAAFAGIAMGLNGLFTAALLPVIWNSIF